MTLQNLLQANSVCISVRVYHSRVRQRRLQVRHIGTSILQGLSKK